MPGLKEKREKAKRRAVRNCEKGFDGSVTDSSDGKTNGGPLNKVHDEYPGQTAMRMAASRRWKKTKTANIVPGEDAASPTLTEKATQTTATGYATIGLRILWCRGCVAPTAKKKQ